MDVPTGGPTSGGAGEAAPAVSVVVPTLGASPYLERCLAALRDDGGAALEIVLVVQGAAALGGAEQGAALQGAAVQGGPARGEAARSEAGRRGGGSSAPRLPADLRARLEPWVDRWIELPDNRGFTGGTNRGLAAARGALLATVNDDAVVQPGWLAALCAALEADPGAAAAQGVNLDLHRPEVMDGRGLAWNRWWQAVQVGRGEPPPPAAAAPGEVFGVSATAALYRRSALMAVAPGGEPFDERLGSWYEDAALAVRLRRAGHRALSVPAARALHAGSATGSRRPARRAALLYGNRWLVAAELLGRRFPHEVPRILLRDLADLLRRPSLAPAVLLGWARAVRRLPGWMHRDPPVVSL